MDHGRLTDLGRAFVAERAENLTRTGPAGDEDGSASGEPTKAELYEQARELGVEGRSAMDKEQLAEHVEQARDQG